jgi:hypothetical protein
MTDASEAPLAAQHPEGTPRPTWDFALMIATVGLLGALGIQSLAGTLYSWWATRTIAGWQEQGYAGFVAMMNVIAAPLLVALVVVMGLCVPKRLFSRGALIVVSALLVVAGVAGWALTSRPAVGLAVYLLGAGAIQLAVVVMTVAGSPTLTFLTEGRVTKVGSGLLHLGFILVALDIAALQGTELFLPGFWVSFALTMGGSALSFYARR